MGVRQGGVDGWEGGCAVRVHEGVAEVAVGEGVGAVFQPDDYGVQFAEGSDQGVVDVEVYDDCADAEA